MGHLENQKLHRINKNDKKNKMISAVVIHDLHLYLFMLWIFSETKKYFILKITNLHEKDRKLPHRTDETHVKL